MALCLGVVAATGLTTATRGVGRTLGATANIPLVLSCMRRACRLRPQCGRDSRSPGKHNCSGTASSSNKREEQNGSDSSEVVFFVWASDALVG
jgi:hypothetical protein